METHTERITSRRALGVIGLATGLSAAVWVLAVPMLGVELDVADYPGGPVGARTVGLASVIVTSVVAGLAGWASLALLTRVTQRGRVIWTWLAAAVTAISAGAPMQLTGTASAAVSLVAMHLVVGTVLITGLVSRPLTRRSASDLEPVTSVRKGDQ